MSETTGVYQEFTTRVNAHPSVIYIDRTRNIIWIPYAGWTPKEQE